MKNSCDGLLCFKYLQDLNLPRSLIWHLFSLCFVLRLIGFFSPLPWLECCLVVMFFMFNFYSSVVSVISFILNPHLGFDFGYLCFLTLCIQLFFPSHWHHVQFWLWTSRRQRAFRFSRTSFQSSCIRYRIKR